MKQESLLVKEAENNITLTISRLEQQNSINTSLLEEINHALDTAEANPKCRLVIIEGQNNIFCTGMDFHEVIQMTDSKQIRNWTTQYITLLKRFTTTPKIIVSRIDGKVLAGGVGLVAASDYVIATEASFFKLSEALWGLLPAMVAPYLIRRVGFHPAYSMALTCRSIPAREAHALHLVDEVTDNLEHATEQLTTRFDRLEESTIKHLKTYFRKLWLIDDAMEERAVEETTNLLQHPRIQENIRNFVEHHTYPWENLK